MREGVNVIRKEKDSKKITNSVNSQSFSELCRGFTDFTE